MQGSRMMAGVGALALAMLLLLAGQASAARPNFVVIVTDDQTLESFNRSTMPRAHLAIADNGITFSQGIVSTPQCCPSRAGFLTGQYSQNNKVVANRPGYKLLTRKREVLPKWLQRAGYSTAHIGKYLNGYTEARGETPGPGWSTWKSLTSADYQRPTWSINGVPRADEDGYLTTTINRMAKRFISKQRRLRRPFYLQVDHLAPHVGSRTEESRCSGAAVPAAENEQLFKDAEAPRTPAVTEADVSDKPEFIQRHGPLLAPDLARADHSYGCSLAALQTVDEGVAAIVSALRKARELKRTMVIFTSDNGYSYAEHRMPVSKGLPYEEHLRVPFVIRPPEGRGFTKRSLVGSSVAAPVSNVDLAPTILKLGKAEPCPLDGRDCRRLDGRSLVPLLRGKARQWTDTRAIRTGFNVNFGDYRRSCEWDGLRTPELMLVNHVELPEPGGTECRAADEYELYDLVNDPFQLEGDIPVPDSLRNRLNDLRRCSGIQGRDKPLKRPFCE